MPSLKGRGAASNPLNRFEQLHLEPLPDEQGPESIPPIFFTDASRSILSRNDSPDIPFTYSINPYRGCEHGCVYCYARPSHEYLGFSAGLDFETRIMVKPDAAMLLEKELLKRSWIPQMVCMSGNTDCYQPVERRLQLTRQCLLVFARLRNPVGIITKNALILRDIDILAKLASQNLVLVTMSLPTLKSDLARTMEPRTSIPGRRLEAVRLLAGRGIPVQVLVAPVIPGLTDEEIPAILEEAKSAGARYAASTLLRLPGAVGPLFMEWMENHIPEKRKRILGLLRTIRDGGLSDERFGTRMSGVGETAKAIHRLFELQCKKLGFNGETPSLATDLFRRDRGGQTEMSF